MSDVVRPIEAQIEDVGGDALSPNWKQLQTSDR